MIKYCIGVDVLNFPIYIYHNVDNEIIINVLKNKIKEIKYLQCLKHRNMIHK